MNATQQPAGYDPKTLAPHVEPKWAEEFAIEARLIGMPGKKVGDALVTVDTHVVDSGESAAEAFGDPKVYARDLAATTPQPRWLSATSILSTGLGLIALILAPRVVAALLEHTGVTFSRADLIAFPALILLTGALLSWPTPILRFMVERRLASVVVVGVVIFAIMFVGAHPALNRDHIFTAPTLLIGIIAAACLIGSVMASLREPVDLLQGPSNVPASTLRRARLLSSMPLPLFTVVMCVFTAVLHFSVQG